MSEFTITIKLDGSDINGEEYARLDELMAVEGFKRRVHLLVGKIAPANLITHPDNLPHATYFGRYSQDASTLQRYLLSRIPSELKPEIAMFQLEG